MVSCLWGFLAASLVRIPLHIQTTFKNIASITLVLSKLYSRARSLRKQLKIERLIFKVVDEWEILFYKIVMSF